MSRQSSTRDHSESTADRTVTIVALAVIALLTLGWLWTIRHAQAAPPAETSPGELAAGTVASGLTHAGAPTTSYLTEAALNAAVNRALEKARGASGKLRIAIDTTGHGIVPETLPPGGQLRYSRGGKITTEPEGAGVWSVLLNVGNAIRPAANFSLIEMLPFGAKKEGRIGLYYVGTWPSEKGKVGPRRAPAGAYGNPKGFIEVTEKNADTQVSEHFKLRDFLTHDQPNVWPKYLVLQPKLVDKLELVLTDLQHHGIDTHGVHVMSGFRTPQYNYTGGNVGGRAGLSRHMYGDASDIFIDSNGDGQMDDLNHDGKISIDDSRVISAAVDRVDGAHPELVGGAGVYTAGPGHGPFIHIDTRGYRARWVGTSGG